MNWLLNRLREPSTWRGLVWMLTALGVSLSPEAWAHITTIGMAAAGLIGVLTREKATVVDIRLPPVELVGVPGCADVVADRRATDQRLSNLPPRSNTLEATDRDGADFPGWGS